MNQRGTGTYEAEAQQRAGNNDYLAITTTRCSHFSSHFVQEFAPPRVLSNDPVHLAPEERRHGFSGGVAALKHLCVGRVRHPDLRPADLRGAPAGEMRAVAKTMPRKGDVNVADKTAHCVWSRFTYIENSFTAKSGFSHRVGKPNGRILLATETTAVGYAIV